MHTWYPEFRSLVINSLGRINPRSVTEKYFSKQNKQHLWESFIQNTAHLEQYEYTKRIVFLDAGHTTELPKCYCGNEISILDRKVSKFCSMKCMLSSEERKSKISHTKQNMDHSVANEKRKNSMLAKYGVSTNSQRPNIHHIWETSTLPPEVYAKLIDYNWLYDEYVTKDKSGVELADKLGCYYGTVLDYCRFHGFTIKRHYNSSLMETQVSEWLTSMGVEHTTNDQSVISPYEIDIFIPSHDLGIELNGLYWHSRKPKDYHEVKTTLASVAGIFLFHFTDEDWNTKTNLVKSMIMNKLGKSKRIGARQCQIRETDNNSTAAFVRTNHLHGHINATKVIGLYYNDELIMVTTFSKSRFHKEYEWEVVRSCAKMGYNVVGGLSRIMSFFRLNYRGSIMTYVDRRTGNGKSYENCGFTYVVTSKPGYCWTDSNVTVSRYKCQKRQLEKWLPNYDSTLTEKQNMINAKYTQYWDCGNKIMGLI